MKSLEGICALRKALGWLCLPLAMGLGACGSEERPPEGHVVVHVDTDAPLPKAPDDANPTSVRAVFDTLEVVAIGTDGEPLAGTLRRTELHTGMFRHGLVSFGVVPANKTERAVLQLTLFLRAHLASSVEPKVTDLAARISLPAAGAENRTDASVFLRTDRTGLRDGWGEPLPAELGTTSNSRIGTWPGSQPVACRSKAGDDEVCVPGGAFWMGDPELRGNADLDDSDRERLVILSPFFLDKKEVTVAAFRNLFEALVLFGFAPPPLFSGSTTGDDEDDFATFSFPAPGDEQPDDRANLPVNGVPWSTARAYCQLIGKDLPTEAMFEYVASGRGNEWQYVWGLDPPECADAVIARGGAGYYSNFDGGCRPVGTIGGPAEGGQGARDTITIGDAPSDTIVDLAGSLTEWTLDVFKSQSELPDRLGVAKDPVQTEPSTSKRVVKGGSWRGTLVEARAGARPGRDPDEQNRSLGFRCARPDD